MDLRLPAAIASNYKSHSQIARVVTEEWAARNLYCPSCDSQNIAQTSPNTKAIDFTCPACEQTYQLKSTKSWNENRVVDAGYQAMIASIRSDSAPNLFVLHYSHDWLVQNILLIPHFFITESAIEKRKPLAPQARRSGWIGCNILLREIPPDGKLRIIRNGEETNALIVRKQFQRIRPFADLRVNLRGWTLDVLHVVHKLGRIEFTLQDVYRYAPELASKHPYNRNVLPKIRQQLQILRDFGFLTFSGRGRYSFRPRK